MRIFRSFEEAAGIPSPIVTTGTFDGVHIGHKTILKRLKKLASDYNGESVLITFHPHPRTVLYPESAGKDLKLILSQEEKIELLRKAGLDNIIIVEFTREFSLITSEMFIRDILCGILKSKVIVVGQNHHFGFNQTGDYRQLWEWRSRFGFEAEEIPMQEVQHETVSSTRIRQALSEGYIQRANAYLDHFYIIIGYAEADDPGLSKEVLFTKIPLKEKTKLVPPPGLYAVSGTADAFLSRGMVFVPPFTDNLPAVYIHFENYDSDLPGKRVTLFFHKRLKAYNPSLSPGLFMPAGVEEMKELIF